MYTRQVFFGGSPINLHIVDADVTQLDVMTSLIAHITWADVILLVYAINDRNSFDFIDSNVSALRNSLHRSHQLLLVGNKRDMSHLRTVTSSEARDMAQRIGAEFLGEISARESRKQVDELFQRIYLSQGLKFNEGDTHKVEKVLQETEQVKSLRLSEAKKSKLKGFTQLKRQLIDLTGFRSRTNTF